MSGPGKPASIAERALQLANSGSCSKIPEIRRHLADEGYDFVDQHLSSPSLRKQLAAAMKATSAP